MSHGHSSHHGILNDVNSLILVAGSWVPTLMNVITLRGVFQWGMLLASALLTVLAIYDHIIKIRWKIKQNRVHDEKEQRRHDENATLVQHLKDVVSGQKELIDQLKNKG